jgi:hypothetical protein
MFISCSALALAPPEKPTLNAWSCDIDQKNGRYFKISGTASNTVATEYIDLFNKALAKGTGKLVGPKNNVINIGNFYVIQSMDLAPWQPIFILHQEKTGVAFLPGNNQNPAMLSIEFTGEDAVNLAKILKAAGIENTGNEQIAEYKSKSTECHVDAITDSGVCFLKIPAQ